MKNSELRAKIEELEFLAAGLQRQLSEAQARRRAYRKSIQVHLDDRDEFKLKTWRSLYADPDDDSPEPRTGLQYYDPEKINGINYDRLDELNRRAAPLMKEYHLMKAVEREWEKKYNDADWEVGFMKKKFKKALAAPQGSLF